MSAEVIPFHIWMECLEVDAKEDVACDQEKSQLLQWLIKESITDVPLLRLIEECDLDKLCGCLSVLKELLNKLGAKATGISFTGDWAFLIGCLLFFVIILLLLLLLLLLLYCYYFCCYLYYYYTAIVLGLLPPPLLLLLLVSKASTTAAATYYYYYCCY